MADACEHEWGEIFWHPTMSYGTQRCRLCTETRYIPWSGRVTCLNVEELKSRRLCRQCEAPLEGRRTAYCSPECSLAFDQNHFWSSAAQAALRRAGHKCETCGQEPDWRDPRTSLEVNHKEPLRGGFRPISCLNHQDNLEVLCRRCHAKVTAQQARDRSRAGRAAQNQAPLLEALDVR